MYQTNESVVFKVAHTVLAIGFRPTLTKELHRAHPHEIIATDHCNDAINTLLSEEIETIFFDSAASQDFEADVSALLSATPVTTRFVLITHTTNLGANQTFAGLGITTLTGPVKGLDLEPYFA